MTTINLRQIPRNADGRLLVGEGTRIVKGQSAIGNVPIVDIPSFQRDIRKDILTAIADHGGAVSRRDIAEALGLRKTTWLNSVIEELVDRGFVTRHHQTWRNGVPMYFYTLAAR